MKKVLNLFRKIFYKDKIKPKMAERTAVPVEKKTKAFFDTTVGHCDICKQKVWMDVSNTYMDEDYIIHLSCFYRYVLKYIFKLPPQGGQS